MRLIKTHRGHFIRLQIWGAFWEYKNQITGKTIDEYEYPTVCLTRKEARYQASHQHAYQGKVKRVWVEWKIEKGK